MREYELTIIIQPQLDDDNREQLIERVSDLILPDAESDSKPIIDKWGLRRLAYPIRKFTEGYYVLYDAKIDPQRISDIERTLQYNEDVLRYLAIRKPE